MKKLYFLLLATLSFYANPAYAVLEVFITGTPGSGATTWTFVGSDTARDSGYFEYDNNLGTNDAWQNIGDFTNVGDLELETVTAGATLTIAGVTRNIDIAYIDTDNGANADDFGVGVSGSTQFTFSAGDTISWAGSLVATGIDINDISLAGVPVTLTGNDYGGTANALTLNVHIGTNPPAATSASVSTPLLVLSISLLFIGLFASRKKMA